MVVAENPLLRGKGIAEQCFGLGYTVPKQNGVCVGGGPGGIGGGASADALLLSAGDDGIELGSEYARSMGFGLDTSWEPAEEKSPRRKKKTRRKRKGGKNGKDEDEEEGEEK